ncbi:MAG: DUF4118 domain-containing protein [Marinobacter sp.]|nr:DUF4118 domain-containing protein [Marinobacter sp.]
MNFYGIFTQDGSYSDYAWAVGSVGVATAVALGLQHVLPIGNLSLVFLTSVLWVAARTGMRPALFTAVLSFLAYNFLFTEPRFTLHMTDSDELLTVMFFLIIAVIGGNLAGRQRDQVRMLRAANDQADALRVAEETERLRSALLSSISHDLRTPLSSMIGSASTLKSMSNRLSEEDRESLLNSVLDEGERLDRYIRNLLDMTKLGHGTLKIERDWIALTDILSSALRRTRNLMSGIRVERNVAEDLPLLFVHPALIEQALVNVLENAAKFAPDGSVLSIHAQRLGDELVIAISDEGPGIPEDQRGQVFDMFFTGGEGDRGPHGSGLGLAICHGMVAAHGGRIRAVPGPDNRGATIEMALPLTESPEQETNREPSA